MQATYQHNIFQIFKEMNKILVSIVCTTYNHEKYIAQALESFIKQQTNFPFEIIVHDDASTDQTALIIKNYESKFDNLIVAIYQSENQYSKKNINIWTDITFPIAKGKYIAICEGDDYWIDPLKLQKQVDFLEKNNDYGLVFTDADILFNETGRVIKSFDRSHEKKIPQGYVLNYLMSSPNPYKTCTALFRQNSLLNYNNLIKDESFLIGDIGLWLYISNRYKVGYINESTAVYRVLQYSAQHFRSFNEFMKFGKEAREIRYFWAKKFNLKISYSKILYMKYRSILIYWIRRIGLKK